MARMQLHKTEVRFRGLGVSGGVFLGSILLAGLTLAGCGTSEVDSIQIAPTTQSVAAGSTVQFTASGIVGHGSHPSSTQDVTSEVAWTSNAPTVATINASGLATGVSAGSAIITATMNGFTGNITASATLTVTGSGSVTPTGNVVSLAIIPNSQSVAIPVIRLNSSPSAPLPPVPPSICPAR